MSPLPLKKVFRGTSVRRVQLQVEALHDYNERVAFQLLVMEILKDGFLELYPLTGAFRGRKKKNQNSYCWVSRGNDRALSFMISLGGIP